MHDHLGVAAGIVRGVWASEQGGAGGNARRGQLATPAHPLEQPSTELDVFDLDRLVDARRMESRVIGVDARSDHDPGAACPPARGEDLRHIRDRVTGIEDAPLPHPPRRIHVDEAVVPLRVWQPIVGEHEGVGIREQAGEVRGRERRSPGVLVDGRQCLCSGSERQRISTNATAEVEDVAAVEASCAPGGDGRVARLLQAGAGEQQLIGWCPPSAGVASCHSRVEHECGVCRIELGAQRRRDGERVLAGIQRSDGLGQDLAPEVTGQPDGPRRFDLRGHLASSRSSIGPYVAGTQGHVGLHTGLGTVRGMELLRLDRPAAPLGTEAILVIAFDGWTDAGEGGSMAADALREAFEPEVIGAFAPDDLFDYRDRRPTIDIARGELGQVEWPEVRVEVLRPPSGPALVLVSGPEPDLNWQRVADDLALLAEQLGIERYVGLGSVPGPIPHTRPVHLIATSSDPDLLDRIGRPHEEVTVPTSAQVAIEAELRDAGLTTLGLWVRIPHYVAGEYPEAARALLEQLTTQFGTPIDLSVFDEEIADHRSRLDIAAQGSDEVREHVAQLEQMYDAELEARRRAAAGEEQAPAITEEQVPTGDDLAAEIERFLQGRG